MKQQEIFEDSQLEEIAILKGQQYQILLIKKTKYIEPQLIFYDPDQFSDTLQFKDFLQLETLSVVTELDYSNLQRVFAGPVDVQVHLFMDTQDQNYLLPFIEAAEYNKNELTRFERGIFTIIKNTDQNKEFYDLFDVKDRQKSFIAATKSNIQTFQLQKYFYDGELTKEGILQFVEDVRLKKIDPYLKSEDPVPDQPEDKLYKLVGRNFKQEVFGRLDRHNLVLFYDSSHKDKQPIKLFKQFLQKYKNKLSNQLIVCTYDLKNNENDLINLDSAPKVLLYNKKQKNRPLTLDFDLNMDNLVRFVSDWVEELKLLEVVQSLGGVPENKLDL